MRAFTVYSEIVAVDKATKNINKINEAAKKMSNSVTKESQISGSAFNRFAQSVGNSVKRASVSLGNFNAHVGRINRNIGKKVDGMLGSLGKLGLAFGLATVIGLVATSNIELDKSFASLSAVTGVAGKEFEGYKEQVFLASKETKMFSGDMAKAFEIIGSQKPELLANAEAMKMVTVAAVTLSKASGEDLSASANNLTGIMNQFNLAAGESVRTIDVLAAGTIAGASSIAETGEAMKNVGTVAKTANMSLEETVASIQLLSLFQLKGAEAGTKFRGSINRLQKSGLGYTSGIFNMNDALTESQQKYDKLGSAILKDAFIEETFGVENKTAGLIMMQNVGRIKEMTKQVSVSGAATEMASKNSNTFAVRLKEIGDAFKNNVVATQDQGAQMQSLKDLMVLVADNMGKIISAVIIAAKVFLIYKAAVIALKIAQYSLQAATFAYNVVLGIHSALLGTASIAMKGNRVAIIAMNIATKAIAAATWIYNTSLTGAIAATWAFTGALLANPMTWVVIGIVALIAGIVLLIKHWDLVKQSVISFYETIRSNPLLSLLLQPIILIVEAIKLLISSWENVTNAFKSGGIVEGLKAIGFSILNFMILPIKLFLESVAKIPGVGKFAQKGLDKINEFQNVT